MAKARNIEERVAELGKLLVRLRALPSTHKTSFKGTFALSSLPRAIGYVGGPGESDARITTYYKGEFDIIRSMSTNIHNYQIVSKNNDFQTAISVTGDWELQMEDKIIDNRGMGPFLKAKAHGEGEFAEFRFY